MITKSDIIKAAYEYGFGDVGFTTADPFPDHKQLLLDRREEYEWTETAGLELLKGTDPTTILANAKTIIVLMEVYFKKSYPRSIEGNFGRCYIRHREQPPSQRPGRRCRDMGGGNRLVCPRAVLATTCRTQRCLQVKLDSR